MKRSAHPKGRGRREAAAESNVIAHFESGTGVPPVSRASVPLAFPQTDAWGLDLSGTETGAGGVGGLLFVKLHAIPGAPILAPCYDGTQGDWREPRETNRRFARQGETSARRERVNGSGNILAYLDCATGQTLARYEYDPFGKLLLKEEDTRVAGRLHHQFSTKYTDEETGLSYYGYRYYAPELGRWVSRDPIGERAGLNLYEMIGNNPVNWCDILGLQEMPPGVGSAQRANASMAVASQYSNAIAKGMDICGEAAKPGGDPIRCALTMTGERCCVIVVAVIPAPHPSMVGSVSFSSAYLSEQSCDELRNAGSILPLDHYVEYRNW